MFVPPEDDVRTHCKVSFSSSSILMLKLNDFQIKSVSRCGKRGADSLVSHDKNLGISCNAWHTLEPTPRVRGRLRRLLYQDDVDT